MHPRPPTDADRLPSPVRRGLLLWSGGVILLTSAFFYSFAVTDIAVSIVRRPASFLSALDGTLLHLLNITAVFYGVSRMFRSAGLHRPLTAALVLAAVPLGSCMQVKLLFWHADLGIGAVLLPLVLQVPVTVLGGTLALGALHRTGGSRAGVPWACGALALVMLLQGLVSARVLREDAERGVAADRAEFDRIVEELTEYPPPLLVLESERWTAVDTANGLIVYERADGAEVALGSWGPGELDPYWVEGDDSGPMRTGCRDEDTVCEDFASDGVNGVVFRATGPYRDFDVRARVEPEPGFRVHADLYTSGDSVEGLTEEEVIALVHDLRPFEEGDAEKVAEEITGGPRP